MPTYDPNETVERLVDGLLHIKPTLELSSVPLKIDPTRPDFLWHALLECFSTMGRASGRQGLIENLDHYNQLRYEALAALDESLRRIQVEAVCRKAKVRMPLTKAKFILKAFARVEKLGGPVPARDRLLQPSAVEEKIKFLLEFHGIGEKSARQILQVTGHPEFESFILIDKRLWELSLRLEVPWASYSRQETFYQEVGARLGVTGATLSQLLSENCRELFDLFPLLQKVSPAPADRDLEAESPQAQEASETIIDQAVLESEATRSHAYP